MRKTGPEPLPVDEELPLTSALPDLPERAALGDPEWAEAPCTAAQRRLRAISSGKAASPGDLESCALSSHCANSKRTHPHPSPKVNTWVKRRHPVVRGCPFAPVTQAGEGDSLGGCSRWPSAGFSVSVRREWPGPSHAKVLLAGSQRTTTGTITWTPTWPCAVVCTCSRGGPGSQPEHPERWRALRGPSPLAHQPAFCRLREVLPGPRPGLQAPPPPGKVPGAA